MARSLISTLLPACVACEEIIGAPVAAPLTPEEEATLARAVEKRRREFGLGRQCARAALARLGVPPVSILPGPERQPLWPAGIVGSITHCTGYCAAAVARQSDIAALGIDAELARPLEPGVVERITLPEERAWIAAQAPEIPWAHLFFSAKESVYKAWFPLTGRWLGFEDVRIEVNPAAGTFTAHLISGEEPRLFQGRYRIDEDRVLTAAMPGFWAEES